MLTKNILTVSRFLYIHKEVIASHPVISSSPLRSPALKPFWLGLNGSDCDALFSSLFRRFFCHASREYRRQVTRCRRLHRGDDGGHPLGLRGVVPAYLLHLTSLSRSLSRGQASCLLSIREERERKRRGRRQRSRNKIVVQVGSELVVLKLVLYSLVSMIKISKRAKHPLVC